MRLAVENPLCLQKKGHTHHKGAQAVLCIARILGKGIMKKNLWPRLNESQHSAGSIHLRVLTNRGVICVIEGSGMLPESSREVNALIFPEREREGGPRNY